MIPIDFPESNKTLTKPKGWTDEECSSLPVYVYDMGVVSCWRLSWRERFSALLFGRAWISILTNAGTQPPISILAARKYFIKKKQTAPDAATRKTAPGTADAGRV